MNSHTPGPWRYEKPKEGDRTRHIRDAAGDALFCDEQYYPWCSTNEADWPLVAAAPDLLQALKWMVASYDVGTRAMIGDSMRAKLACADAAIAKAEGK